MLRVSFLLRHANPLERVQAAATGAAIREAAVQLDRIKTIDLDLEPPHHRIIVQRWQRELRQLLRSRRRA